MTVQRIYKTLLLSFLFFFFRFCILALINLKHFVFIKELSLLAVALPDCSIVYTGKDRHYDRQHTYTNVRTSAFCSLQQFFNLGQQEPTTSQQQHWQKVHIINHWHFQSSACLFPLLHALLDSIAVPLMMIISETLTINAIAMNVLELNVKW